MVPAIRLEGVCGARPARHIKNIPHEKDVGVGTFHHPGEVAFQLRVTLGAEVAIPAMEVTNWNEVAVVFGDVDIDHLHERLLFAYFEFLLDCDKGVIPITPM